MSVWEVQAKENGTVAPAGRLHRDPGFRQGDDGNDDDDNEARAGDIGKSNGSELE